MKTASSDYDIGSIYWLPALNRVPREHLYATVPIDPGCFDHPVVILWVNAQKTEAIILTITSFGGTDLQLKYPHNTRARSQYLPIYPSNTHPDNGSRLFFKDNARLRRNSYVTTEPQRTVKTVLLQPNHQSCTLRKDSFNELVKHISFQLPLSEESHQKPRSMQKSPRSTHKLPRAYQAQLDLVTSVEGGRVKPPLERRFVVHVQQALPAHQTLPVQQALRPQYAQPTFPPRPLYAQQVMPPRPQYAQQAIAPRQPPAVPYIQYNAFSSPRTANGHSETTPLLRTVQPVPHVYRGQHAHGAPEPPDEGRTAIKFIGSIALCILLWTLWQKASA